MIDRHDKKKCIKCGKDAVVSSYLENQRYKYKCHECGQYFEYNATSWLEADIIYKHVICKQDNDSEESQHGNL